MDEYIKREDAIKAIQTVREVMSESMIRHRHVPDCVKSLCEEVIDASKKVINRIPPADVVPKSEVEKGIKNWQELYADTVSKWEKAYEELEIKLEKDKAEVASAFRQRMNEKMGKHTHLLGKEYVQRIMREIEKEFSEVENDRD